MMETIRTLPWDAADHLKTQEDMAAYLEAALEDGDPALITAVLGDIARAQGIARIARESGLERDRLCQDLSPEATRSLRPFSGCSRLQGSAFMPRSHMRSEIEFLTFRLEHEQFD